MTGRESGFRLVLRNGVELDALGEALEFIEKDGTYGRYDLAPVEHDDTLTEADVRTANAIIARMPARVISDVAARAPTIGAAFAEIPPDASLLWRDEEVPWAALRRLFETMDGIPEVGLARATKVLHRKRPALIPILDSVVERYLRSVESLDRPRGVASYAVELVRAYKRELDANAGVLTAVREELEGRGLHLTECRLLDIYLWAYSGTYEPLWQRSPGSPLPGPNRPAEPIREGVPDREMGDSDMSVTKFQDDDAGYLAWLAAHPRGFVLNAERKPQSSNLILHRASCWTIGGRPSRGDSWTRAYIKICADDTAAIEEWTAKEVGGPPRRCQFCN